MLRLKKLEKGHRWPQRMMLGMVRMMIGHVPDVMKILLYRPAFFGAPASNVFDAVMRGPSDWSCGERELFAAYTSKLNQCPF